MSQSDADKKPAKPKKDDAKLAKLQADYDNVLSDLQRTRADFENYRKRAELEKQAARAGGQVSAITKLLPVIDLIDRAIGHVPAELADNPWAKGVVGVSKKLNSTLQSLEIEPVKATPGTVFDPNHHEAIQFDEDSEGEHEVIAEQLQTGYMYQGSMIRPAMVKVSRQADKPKA